MQLVLRGRGGGGSCTTARSPGGFPPAQAALRTMAENKSAIPDGRALPGDPTQLSRSSNSLEIQVSFGWLAFPDNLVLVKMQLDSNCFEGVTGPGGI